MEKINLNIFKQNQSKSVPDFYLSLYKLIYCFLIIVGILRYFNGYEIFFTSFTLVKNLNFIITTSGQFTFTLYALILSLFITAILPNKKLTVLITLALFSLIHINISPYLQEYTTNLSFFILLSFLLTQKTHWSKSKESKSHLFQISWLLLSLTYLASAISKLIENPVGWFNGQLLVKHMEYSIHLTQSKYLAIITNYNNIYIIIISFLVLFFELTFILSYFYKRLLLPYIIIGSAFHLSVLILFKINFFYFYYPAYIAGFFILLLNKCSIKKPGKSK